MYDIQILASHHIHIEANKIYIHVSNDELEEAQAADLPSLAVPLVSPSKETTAAHSIAPLIETSPSLEVTAPLEMVTPPLVQLLG